MADLFKARPVTTYVTPWQLAILYTRVGNKEKSIFWLREACYRAGNEVNDAVTVFVKDCLKGEIVSGTKTKAIQDVALAPAVSDSHHSPKTEANKPTASSDEQRDTNTSEETPESPKEKAGLLGKLKKAKGILKDQTRANLK